jgi:hypothetical protein
MAPLIRSQGEAMEKIRKATALFIAGFGPIVIEAQASRELYGRAFVIPFKEEKGGYLRWRKGDSYQQAFRSDEATDGLAPRLIPVPDQRPIPLCFKFCRKPNKARPVMLRRARNRPHCGVRYRM